MDGSVLGPKLAEFEQVAAARRAKNSREYLLQRGAKRDTASWQIVLLCASSEAVIQFVRRVRGSIKQWVQLHSAMWNDKVDAQVVIKLSNFSNEKYTYLQGVKA